MKLFDLNFQEKAVLKIFIAWHLLYILLITIFFFIIYEFNWFKSTPLLKESGIFNFLAPLCTVVFIMLSPWRKDFFSAFVDLYHDLEGDILFCLMAFLIFGVGFYLYSGLIWALGCLLPLIFYI